jgi:hypothetical protein
MKRPLLLAVILAGCSQAPPPQGLPAIAIGMAGDEARARLIAADFAAVAIRSINVDPENTKNTLTDVTTVYSRPAGVVKIREVDSVVVDVQYNPVAQVPPAVSKY